MALGACGSKAPAFGEQHAVNTPLYADNRVYFLEPRNDGGSFQKLSGLGEGASKLADSVPRNAPLSIIMRSVDIPASLKTDNGNKNLITGPADYAVILDVGASADGSTKSIVVWYQRGVQPDQSLNFSNLLIYYEPQWDERVPPFFRVRVMDVTNERNEQTRKALERAGNIASGLGALALNPMLVPLIGISFTSAELVLANAENRLIVDYSVQLYSEVSVSQSGDSGLGTLRRGSYVVVGRPNTSGREFWETSDLKYQIQSRRLFASTKLINVPTALITVGTFKSIVPTLVLERSAALTLLLTTSGTKTSVEQLEEASERLSISVKSLALGERLEKYRRSEDAKQIIGNLTDPEISKNLGADNTFNLLQALNTCYKRDAPFESGKDVANYYRSLADKRCKE